MPSLYSHKNQLLFPVYRACRKCGMTSLLLDSDNVKICDMKYATGSERCYYRRLGSAGYLSMANYSNEDSRLDCDILGGLMLDKEIDGFVY